MKGRPLSKSIARTCPAAKRFSRSRRQERKWLIQLSQSRVDVNTQAAYGKGTAPLVIDHRQEPGLGPFRIIFVPVFQHCGKNIMTVRKNICRDYDLLSQGSFDGVPTRIQFGSDFGNNGARLAVDTVQVACAF